MSGIYLYELVKWRSGSLALYSEKSNPGDKFSSDRQTPPPMQQYGSSLPEDNQSGKGLFSIINLQAYNLKPYHRTDRKQSPLHQWLIMWQIRSHKSKTYTTQCSWEILHTKNGMFWRERKKHLNPFIASDYLAGRHVNQLPAAKAARTLFTFLIPETF